VCFTGEDKSNLVSFFSIVEAIELLFRLKAFPNSAEGDMGLLKVGLVREAGLKHPESKKSEIH